MKLTKGQMIAIATRNLRKAQYAFQHNYNRAGITEREKENLMNNVEYNQIVFDLINKQGGN